MAVLVAGLGNPGERYAGTRHNVGFMLLDRMALAAKLDFQDSPWNASFAKLSLKSHVGVLLKPLTFMNLSGQAVGPACRELGIEPAQVLVISDEVQMPVGKLKLSVGGSDGGHNGLASLIHELGTRNFLRLRIGVGQGPPGMMKEHVLQDFTSDERELLDPTLDLGAEAIRYWISMGGSADAFKNATTRFNDKRKQPLEIRLAAERAAERKRLQEEAAAKAEAEVQAESNSETPGESAGE